MNRNCWVLMAIICLLQTVQLNAQTSKKLEPGTQMPEFSFKLLEGDKVQMGNFKNYKGKKSLILDFWHTTCASCVAAMPHVLELQKQFNDRVQFIFVTTNTLDEIKAFRERYRVAKGKMAPSILEASLNIPFIIEGSVLTELLPGALGNNIWIDSRNVYKYASYSNTTTVTNVSKFINGEIPQLAHYNRNNLIDVKNPLSWLTNNPNSDPALGYSLLVRYMENTGKLSSEPNIERDSVTGRIRLISALNRKKTDLYKLAFFRRIGIEDDKDVILEVQDKQSFVYPKEYEHYFTWAKSNLFGYAFNTSGVLNDDEVYQIVQRDLDREFGLQSAMEIRKVKMFVLKKTDEKLFLAHSGSSAPKKDTTIAENNRPMLLMQNAYVNRFVTHIRSYCGMLDETSHFINEIGTSGKIDIKIPWFWLTPGETVPDLNVMQKALQKYGLSLTEEYRDREVLVIRDRK